jgi:hypothetical protein
VVLARAAGWQDAPAIASIHLHVWQTMYKGIVPDAVVDRLDAQIFEDHWREVLQRGDPRDLCVAVDDDDGNLSAFAHVILPPGSTTAEVVRVLVSSALIGGEAFFVLTGEIERTLVRRGYRETLTWVSTAHTVARSTLEALGWQRDGGSRVGEQFGVVVLEVCYRRALPTAPAPPPPSPPDG